MKTLYLIDGSSYFYRAFFAIRPLTTSQGHPVNAVYGFTTMLIKILKGKKPDYLAMVFDSEKETHRHRLYEDYKAHREEMPSELVSQLPYITQVTEAFEIPILKKEGYEADDLIATVCHLFRDASLKIVMVSSDKDLMQLIDSNITMLDTMRDRVIDTAFVREKFGVAPSQVADVLGLAGDASDHIPGVTGIGFKTAAKLIQDYGSVENVLKQIDHLSGKVAIHLKEEQKMARLSKQLVILEKNIPIDLKLDDFKTKTWNEDALVHLFSELEFQKLIQELGLKSNALEKISPIERNYKCITSENDFERLLRDLKQVDHLVLDVETTSLDPHQAKLVGVALAYQPDQKIQVCYIPVGHQTGPQLAMPYVLNHLKYFFESPQIEKWGQNLKYDALVLAHHGITVSPIAQDSMVASYVLNPAEPHNLDSLSLKHLGHQTIHYEEVTGKGKKQIGFDAVSLEKATEYSGEDADVTYRLVEMLSADLKKSALASIYNQIEMPLVAILIDMERTGVKIDQPYLQNMSRSLVQEMEQVEQEIYQLAGGAFNIQSPKQLAQILFEKLKLPVLKKTKTGNSTNEEVLQKLAGQHPLPQKILAFRELAKLKSTYVDALLAQCDPKTSRVHTSFNQTIAETGRLSSSNPNLQNIPIRSAMGQKIREAFIAKEGCVLLACDYSQIELRLLAHMSQDPALLDAFGHNRDVHVQTASEVFGVPETQVTPELRRMAKTINFGLMYGLSAFGLSQQLEISQSEAKAYIDRYFQRYAHVEKFLRTLIERARERGFSETLLGRRRYLTEIKSANPQMRAFSERMAINTPVQGTAADLIKLAMIGISKYLKTNELGSKMILQVHDELVFEVPQDELQRLQEQVVLQMMHAISLSVPLKVDVKTGKNWGCCKVMDSPTFL